MINKIKKICIYLMCITLAYSNIELSYASIDASDEYVSKAEFDLAFADVNAKISSFDKGVKIDEVIDSYLSANYYKKTEFDVLLLNKQNNIIDNIPGSAGQVLKRNATNDGLEFGDIADYYEKSEVDILLDNKQNNIIDNISGSAGQVLKRNVANNGLEFGDIGDYYEKSEIDTLLANKQNNILSISGSANQYLRRNSSNNGLEFATITTGHLYQHNIRLALDSSGNDRVVLQLVNDNSTAYSDFSTLVSDIKSQGFESLDKCLRCGGGGGGTTSLAEARSYFFLWAPSSGLAILTDKGSTTNKTSINSINDIVIQIQ